MNIQDMPTDELRHLLSRVTAEINDRCHGPRRITQSFRSYNEKRYSKPWIARVTKWPIGSSAELSFGHYLGTMNGGEAEILAKVGDVVRWGQKDNRGPHTVARWGIVEPDGSVRECTEAEASKVFWGDL